MRHNRQSSGLRASLKIVIAPAERIDLVIDFKETTGTEVILNDEFLGVMQLRVRSGSVRHDSVLPATLCEMEKLQESSASKTPVLPAYYIAGFGVRRPLSNRIPSEHARISNSTRPTTLASNQKVQTLAGVMKTLFGAACRKCS